MQECKREESKQRQLRRKTRKKEDDAWKRMETAGNAALATTKVEEPLKKEKRELQRHKPPRVACSAAVNKLKQADKESSAEAKEEKTATVDTTEGVEEVEDKKPAAVQRVQPYEVAQLGQEEGDSLLLEDILLAQEERHGRLHGIVPEGEEHQMVGVCTANVGLMWNYKEMGVFMPTSPNHPAVLLMKEFTFFSKTIEKSDEEIRCTL